VLIEVSTATVLLLLAPAGALLVFVIAVFVLAPRKSTR
jgi:hypothetical protein